MKWPNSTEMIGPARKYFDIACLNPNHNLSDKDWHAWYNGWIEGRFELCGRLINPDVCAKVDISLPGIKRLSPEEWEEIKNKLGKNRSD